MKEYLKDKAFIKTLMEHRNRTTYVRITALNIDLTERNEIIGYATEGSINVDGASAVRRSCNLTLITNEPNINNYDWALNTRFRLEVGIKNCTSSYTDEFIIWFPQGVYIITSFNSALGAGSYTISISGQDKMCLMNGEVSGQLTAETDFGKYDEIDGQGNTITHDLTLREIITSLVHTYGLEPLENIVIELPDHSGYNLLTYRGEDPLYILRNTVDNKVENFTFVGGLSCYDTSGRKTELKKLANYWSSEGIRAEENKGTLITCGGASYYVQKIEYGQQAGYEETPLIFAGELRAAAGEAVTNILDKIKNMLGEFEYFYDVDGIFRFQKKKTYLKTYMNEEDTIQAFTEGEYSYKFNDLSMFTSFNTNPNLKNLKNDFTVWGEYKTTAGATLPIHMRVAIDTKPISYTSPWQNNKTYSTTGEGAVDWRELIYQMALDYQAHHLESDYNDQLEAANPNFVIGGRTGYEQYYTDMLGFWRMLYEPDRNQAIRKWIKTSGQNLSVEKYYYPWVTPTSFDFNKSDKLEDGTTITIKPYTSWYIQKALGQDKYRIRWIDSLDLSPSNSPMYCVNNEVEFSEKEKLTSIRRLFKLNKTTGIYTPILRNLLPEASYYVYERDQNGNQSSNGPINLVNSTTWGIEENLASLFIKKPSDSDSLAEPMMLKCPVNSIGNSTDIHKYRPGLYCQYRGGGLSVGVYYDSFQYYDSNGNGLGLVNQINWNDPTHIGAAKDAFQSSNRVVYLYNSNDVKNTYSKYDSSKLQAYLIRSRGITATEGYSHALYIRQPDNTLKLYAQYLMDKGVRTMVSGEQKYQVLDESWLWNPNSQTSMLEGIKVDRNALYRKTSDNQFVPAFEAEELLTNEVKQALQVRGTTLTLCAGTNMAAPLEEQYYTTKLDGSLDTRVTLKRPLEYWTYQTDYDLNTYWLKSVDNAPETLMFWFDFIDPQQYEELLKYSACQIGARPLVKNEKMVKAIFYPTIPDIYFGDNCPLEEGSKQYFTISSQGQSAHDTIDAWLYNHTYITESVSVNSIPLYNLEPNSKIKIDDEEHNIHGDYIVDKLTIPLAYNGIMSITATKAPETF